MLRVSVLWVCCLRRMCEACIRECGETCSGSIHFGKGAITGFGGVWTCGCVGAGLSAVAQFILGMCMWWCSAVGCVGAGLPAVAHPIMETDIVLQGGGVWTCYVWGLDVWHPWLCLAAKRPSSGCNLTCYNAAERCPSAAAHWGGDTRL